MKSNEFTDNAKGTYAGMKLDEKSVNKLISFAKPSEKNYGNAIIGNISYEMTMNITVLPNIL